MMAQKVHEIMTADPATVPAQAPVSEAARLMGEQDIGAVLVTEEGRLRGVLTDRDIAVRVVAEMRSSETPAAEVCSPGPVVTCSPGDDVERAAVLMREHALRRLPVVDEGRLVGVLSLGDLALELDQRSALADISAARPNN
ncbi:MAG TPA: CBS domain-containing protein [Actinospica sp.]|jgi:CBS domain-containing protein|nr:CBS domain-containing protein [Actinospica sp.]